MLELSISSCWKFCGTLLGCVSVLSIECLLRVLLPGVNVHVSTFFSFSCMDCFPRKDGVFSMPGGNSAWLKLKKSGKILCVRQFCS